MPHEQSTDAKTCCITWYIRLNAQNYTHSLKLQIRNAVAIANTKSDYGTCNQCDKIQQN